MNLIFGVHNHQPVGNFERVFKKAHRDCYRPFMETLYNFPEVKATVHLSGSLIDWFLKNDQDLLQKIKEMVRRLQVELLTGGYYEPILPIIPERDQSGQIELLSDFIKDYFRVNPVGAWLSERVWAPQLIPVLIQAGIRYIFLDDFHFYLAGIKDQDLRGYYFTGEAGRTIAVFPISKELRYILPFSPVAKLITYLKTMAEKNEGAAAIIVDDGEKFGLWPGTHKWVYQQRWLEQFFRQVTENRDWLKTYTPSRYLSEHSPLGRCRLPAASYAEMSAWCDGVFENFFRKYPEANNLHKRMLYVSEKLRKNNNQQARRHLYMGQCNCPYWHGVFGGIYLTHLRHTAYSNLLAAESLADKQAKQSKLECTVFDFDRDGQNEVILRNQFLNIFFAPGRGGAIFELDYLPRNINLTDTMSRRPETYHRKIMPQRKKLFAGKKKEPISIHDLLSSKEKGLENLLIYDTYRRFSLLDHFFLPGLTFADFKNSHYRELGDFIEADYLRRQKAEPGMLSIILQREGEIDYSAEKILIRVTKVISLNDKEAQLAIEYKLENLSRRPLDIIFGIEFNISPESQSPLNNLRCDSSAAKQTYSLKQDVQASGVEQLYIRDAARGVKIGFKFSPKNNIWSYPLETVSASEAGFERNYQQTVLLPHWLLNGFAGSWKNKIILSVHSC